MNNVVEVVAQVLDAFSKVHKPLRIMSSSASLEGQQVAAFFKSLRWQDVSLALLRAKYIGDISACLEFLDGPSGLYFLPAYLTISVESYWEADMLPITLERQLAENPVLSNNFMSLAPTLSIEQAGAVASALHFIRGYYESNQQQSGADKALQNYWSTFLTG